LKFLFDKYRLEVQAQGRRQRHKLFRNGALLHAEPTTLHLLQYLAERSGEELREKNIYNDIWGGRDDLGKCVEQQIRKLRQVLEDFDPKGPRFIKTIHGFGYKFLANVAREQELEEHVSLPPQSRPTKKRALDLSGKWEYTCTVISRGRPVVEWGGVATIYQEGGPFGIQWGLKGERQWQRRGDKKGPLNPPIPWSSTWGTITQDDEVRFGYQISTPKINVEGYGHGAIQPPSKSGGRPKAFIGMFYQLPTSTYGRLEFRRAAKRS